ncbi:LOW QUALITY PROTEIN: pentatricopeptide repeat-containing protein At2g20540-like [Pyrus x bretschneideri]|uniref:LOW QUALITY PROTEIN: pentatricopeptide repeat-containing protein At2g20540-like n=1 Tax=Pyrus x bretschneideri TaxID=225117 RepID=UPI00202DE68F|nr:LOW QUALITY PROTEIN: pentatricopeptide repeat-containing protein At2g20540-like [Pyrus x bretschneideri]
MFQRSPHILHSPLLLKFLHFPATQTTPFSTLSSLFSLCTEPRKLQQIHARFVLHGLHQNPTLSSQLIDRYANLGLLGRSEQVFNSVTDPSPILYDAIIRKLSEFGQFEKTLLVYNDMVMKSIYPDRNTYPFVLKSCSHARIGGKIHGHVVKLGFDSYDLVGAALVDVYGNYGGFGNAGEVVDEMSVWEGGLDFSISEASRSGKAMEKLEPESVNSVTVINLLRSSVDLNSLKAGKAVHCVVVVRNLCEDLSVNTALLSMYAKLGDLKYAELLFGKMPDKDSVVWNIMISAYARNRHPKESLELLRCMGRSGVRADLFTAIPAISSIAQLRATDWGKQMHAHVIRNGSDYQVSIHNSLIDMYCACDDLNSAQKIFDLVPNKTVVSWSAMIKGYVTHDRSLDALSLFSKMKADGLVVDFITVINILPACVNLGALENVKYLHGYSMKLSLNSLSSVNTAFLVSYAKCGCIEMARKLFDEENINTKDVITWNSMISAYAKHGDWSRSFELYHQMKKSSLKPDQVTFLGVLTACVNAGLVQEGKECFKEMVEKYDCQPSHEHYACMVDLLGRAGHVNEARELVKSMPFRPDARVWGPLLSACKLHSETGVAEFAAEKLITMEPKNPGNYILLANIYAADGKWDRVAKLRSSLRNLGLKKTPGLSWVEINGLQHEFRVADRSHPRSDGIYAILRNLEWEIKDARDRDSV